jgi:hypothetical protein
LYDNTQQQVENLSINPPKTTHQGIKKGAIAPFYSEKPIAA